MTIYKLLRFMLIDMFVFPMVEGDPPADPPSDPPADPPKDPPADPPQNYFGSVPDTWRNDLVTQLGFEGEEADKRMGQLERIPDINTFAKNYFEGQDKIRKGELSNGLPENPTDEQLADWREANGVPAAAKEYQVEYDQGLEVTDDQKEVFSAVYDAAFEGNVNNDTMGSMLNAAVKAQAQIQERREAQDSVDAQQGQAALREAWGGDYQANINRVDALLSRIPEEIRDDFKGARMADGRGVLNTPGVMEFLASMSREVDPAGSVVPNASNPVQAVEDEIKQIETTMRDDPDKYWGDRAMQQRLEDLYEAQERIQAA